MHVAYCFHAVTQCNASFSAPILQPSFVFKQLSMEGFIVSRWGDSWDEGINYNLQLIQEVRSRLILNGQD
jgi:hypothetical protein